MLLRIALFCGIALRVSAQAPPLVDYVTYLGGSYTDTAVGIAVDSTGDAYVAGNTTSPDFPVTSTSLGTPSTHNCAFITKFNPSGSAIDFSICLANSNAIAFALDASGNMYLVTATAYPGNSSVFGVVKLDPTGQSILFTTPLGGNPEAIALDAAGDIFVTGTAGPGLATTTGVYQPQSPAGQCAGDINAPPSPCSVAFITKLSPSGSVVWSTYLGGTGPDDAHTIAVDSAGNVWVAGQTVSPNFPTTANAISRTFGGEIDLGPLRFGDAFVSKLDPTGSLLLYSTYLGGSQADEASGIAVDSSGAAYVAGGTQSNNFPTTPGAYRTTNPFYNPNQMPAYGGDGFVTKIDSSGDLIYSTLTGLMTGIPTPIVVDATGQTYVSAVQDASSSMIQPTCAGPLNQAVLVFNSAGSTLAASSPIPARISPGMARVGSIPRALHLHSCSSPRRARFKPSTLVAIPTPSPPRSIFRSQLGQTSLR
jgi:Beta-propeller repeat